MNSTSSKRVGARVLVIVGGIAMLVGAADPLEGSVIILAGSGLVTLGTFLSDRRHDLLRYWMGIFGSIAFGVGAMFVLSSVGFGGRHGVSMWWGLLMVPYPIGWVLGMVNLLFRIIENFRRQTVTA